MVQCKLNANRDVVALLSRKMIEEGLLPTGALLSDENNLEHCTLELMSSLLQAQLKSFILAHDNENQLVSKIPKKRTLD